MAKSRFRTQFSGHTQRVGSENPGLSETIPNSSMTIKEILLRFAQGLGAPASRPMFYGGNEFYPNLDNMSLTDQMDYYRSVVADVDAKKAEANRLRDERMRSINENRSKLDEMRRKLAEYDAQQIEAQTK